MAVSVTLSKGAIPAAQIVDPATVVARSGDPQALGVTIPKIKTDLSGVSFKQRQATVREFSFDFGTIKIDLSQEVFLANDLSTCEQRKWAAHEQLHVNDNRNVMDVLEAEFMQYGMVKDVFVDLLWYPVTSFQLVQQGILGDIGDAFFTLTDDAARARDSSGEYRRVAREILNDCPGPLMYTIQAGDNLSKIALHYYGAASKWKKIFDANRGKIKNPNLIRTGDKIEIPR